VGELPAATAHAGTGEALAPPEFVTVESALRLDIDHSMLMINL